MIARGLCRAESLLNLEYEVSMRVVLSFVFVVLLGGCASFPAHHGAVDKPVPSGQAGVSIQSPDTEKPSEYVSDIRDQELEEVVEDIPDDVADQVLEPLSPAEKQALSSESSIEFNLDVCETKEVQLYFQYYAKKHHKTFARWLKRAEPFLPYIRDQFTRAGLPQDLIFLPFAESGFNPWAYSHAGAAGLWQFMPATARAYGMNVDWWIDERRNPYLATEGAIRYLSKLHSDFDDWYLALAAYNAGEGTVSRGLKKSGCTTFFELAGKKSFLPKETKHYVPKFLAILKIVRNLEKLGFDPIDWNAGVDVATLSVKGGTDLVGLAKAGGLSWKDFRRWNPAFRRQVSPPGHVVEVVLPRESIARARSYQERPGVVVAQGVKRYKIRRGDSWWKIARQNGVPLAALKKMNTARGDLLKIGQYVLIPGSGNQPIGEGSRSKTRAIAQSRSNYRVARGDSIWAIAKRFGVSQKTLLQANGLRSGKYLQVGQKLYIPDKGGRRTVVARAEADSAHAGLVPYKVRSGDTVWDIARRFGVSAKEVLKANGLGSGKHLQIGERLFIPSGGGSGLTAKAEVSRVVRYRVRSGDNLWSIASRFGVSTRELQSWNKLGASSMIRPGDELRVLVP